MSTDDAMFREAHTRVCALIDNFEQHADTYLQPGYQEAEARKDFIDPLFKALGWDVDHKREHNPYEQTAVPQGLEQLRAPVRAAGG